MEVLFFSPEVLFFFSEVLFFYTPCGKCGDHDLQHLRSFAVSVGGLPAEEDIAAKPADDNAAEALTDTC